MQNYDADFTNLNFPNIMDDDIFTNFLGNGFLQGTSLESTQDTSLTEENFNFTGLQPEATSRSPLWDEQLPGPSYQSSSIAQTQITNEISNIEGPFQFEIAHPREINEVAAKGASWTYSWALEELYAKMNVECPFIVKVNGFPPIGTVIRATPYYQRPEDQNNVPKRCLNHSSEKHQTNIGHNAPDHIIRSNISDAEYLRNETTGRMSTSFPYKRPEWGMSTSTFTIKFMCRTSCSGGMNRRPICVVFTLEYNGKCFGRQVRKVRVCACPGRDRTHEETRLGHNIFERPPVPSLKENVKKACKRISSTLKKKQKDTKRSKTYTVYVSSKAVYELLKEFIPILERRMRKEDASSQSSQEEN